MRKLLTMLNAMLRDQRPWSPPIPAEITWVRLFCDKS
jgi:hypothetical protein